MAFSNLARARGFVDGFVGLVPSIAALALMAGCHSGAVGGGGGDGAVDAGADVNEKLPPPDADCSDGGPGCPVLSCGAPKAVSVLGPNQLAMLGADAVCTPGYTCIPGAATASGDALQLRCVTPLASAVAFGAACGKGATATNRCKDDALCIEAAGAAGQPFCSALCRADGDCPVDAYCLEYKSQMLPNGSYVNLGFCTPKAKIAGTACTREADCATGQGCLPYGARTNLMTCQAVAGTKSVGQRCTKTSECRSGQCVDREFHVDVNEAYCSGPCGKNSDCAADQRCARIVANNNGTPADPFDDLVVGACETLFAPMAGAGCKKDADCSGAQNGGNTCAMKYGLCYTAGAPSGAACTTDQQCELGAFCNHTLRGGYCQTLGCAPGAAAGSVDACPGAKSVCAQRGAERPLFACYEGCDQSGNCSRVSERYACEPLGGADAGAGAGAGGSSADAATSSTDGAADGGSDAANAFSPVGLCLYNQGV
jgi:hypothetical protein